MEKGSAINIEDLRCVINKIIDHIKYDLEVEEFRLTKNFYWDLADDSLYELDKDPETPSIGNLQDDWDFLRPLLSQDRNQAVSLMLLHVAPLLRYLGRKIGQ